jgi:Flp pilus assembly protein TadD
LSLAPDSIRSPRRSPVVPPAWAGALLLTGLLGVSPPLLARAQETVVDDRAEAARQNPRDYAAQRAYGEALLRAGRFPEARRQMARAARLERSSLEAHYDVARVEFAAGDTRRARRACVALRRRDRAAALTKVCEARAFLAENRSGRAFDQLEAALAAAPEDARAWTAMGDARRLRGQLDEARAAYRKAAELAPEDPAPHIGLGRLEAAARRDAQAVAALRQAYRRDPEDPVIQFELAEALPAGDEQRTALLEKAVAGRPSWPEAWAALGDALFRDARPSEAENAYRKAIAEGDELAPAHAGLGRALAAQDDLDGAEAALRRALELVPNYVEAKLALAGVLADNDQTELALGLYREAANLDPSDPRPLVRAARLALAEDRDVTASGYITRAASIAGDHALVLEAQGDLARHRGRKDQATSFYRRALAADRGRGELDRSRVERALATMRD